MSCSSMQRTLACACQPLKRTLSHPPVVLELCRGLHADPSPASRRCRLCRCLGASTAVLRTLQATRPPRRSPLMPMAPCRWWKRLAQRQAHRISWCHALARRRCCPTRRSRCASSCVTHTAGVDCLAAALMRGCCLVLVVCQGHELRGWASFFSPRAYDVRAGTWRERYDLSPPPGHVDLNHPCPACHLPELVAASPLTGLGSLRNADAMKQRIVYFERGEVRPCARTELTLLSCSPRYRPFDGCRCLSETKY